MLYTKQDGSVVNFNIDSMVEKVSKKFEKDFENLGLELRGWSPTETMFLVGIRLKNQFIQNVIIDYEWVNCLGELSMENPLNEILSTLRILNEKGFLNI